MRPRAKLTLLQKEGLPTSYIRISLMMPAQGKQEEITRLNQELAAFYRAQEGWRDSFAITAADGSGELGRLSVWDSREAVGLQ